jgi:hypothetical protein
MSRQLTADDARQSLNVHVEAKGLEIYAKYGPQIRWKNLLCLLADRTYVRYPCEIVFDSALLQEGEFAFPAAKGESPEEGFTIFVHPFFMTELDRVPALVLYQLVLINYGDFASAEDAEVFGAAALGLTTEEYYELICNLADEVC